MRRTSQKVERLAAQFLDVFPIPDFDGQRVAVALYRLLSRGDPVSPDELASTAGVPEQKVNEFLEGCPALYYENDRIVGFWGLSPKPVSNHRLNVAGTTVFAWCAWDSLFLPQILGEDVKVESQDPQDGTTIRLLVTPDAVATVEPDGAVVSILELTTDMTVDVVGSFCHFVHFFASRDSARPWIRDHPGTTLLTIEEAFELGRWRNFGQFGDVLRDSAYRGASPTDVRGR